jgi:hypothetical protein
LRTVIERDGGQKETRDLAGFFARGSADRSMILFDRGPAWFPAHYRQKVKPIVRPDQTRRTMMFRCE